MLVHQGDNQLQRLVERLVDPRPFIHQVDAVLTTEARHLSSLATSYYAGELTFSALFDAFADSTFTALSVGTKATEDVWCLDSRGILSLLLTDTTYEELGIIGAQIRGRRNKFSKLVQLDLRDVSTLAVRARDSLRKWDDRRQQAGQDGWQVLLSSDFSHAADGPGLLLRHDITAQFHPMQDVYIPPSMLPSFKSDNAREEMTSFFEWLGLASLGSERLFINDKPNRYVAAYLPPDGSSSGSIFHLRWTGFLTPAFVRSILESVIRVPGLRGISTILFDSPVTHTGTSHDGEDVWSLILSEESHDSSENGVHWLLAERN